MIFWFRGFFHLFYVQYLQIHCLKCLPFFWNLLSLYHYEIVDPTLVFELTIDRIPDHNIFMLVFYA